MQTRKRFLTKKLAKLKLWETMENIHKDNYAGAGLILLQDCGLSGVASLLSILLVRWLSEPIADYTSLEQMGVEHFIPVRGWKK